MSNLNILPVPCNKTIIKEIVSDIRHLYCSRENQHFGPQTISHKDKTEVNELCLNYIQEDRRIQVY